MDSTKRRNFNMRMKYGSSWDSPLFKNTPVSNIVTAEPEKKSTPVQDNTANDIPFDNRIENYQNNIHPILTLREFEVLEAVKKTQPCTMHQVAKFMQRELNTISGRFGALVEKGYLKIKGKTDDHRSLYITAQTNGEISQ